MNIFTKAIRAKLEKNDKAPGDHAPVLKLFNPAGQETWLISEIAEDGDTMFGLCDLGHGEPELGYVSLAELTGVRLPYGLSIERDIHFKGTKPLTEYAADARAAQRIIA